MAGSYPVLGPPPCPAQAAPPGPAVPTDPLCADPEALRCLHHGEQVLKVPERGMQAAEAGWPAQEPRGRPPEHALGSGPAHGSPGHSRPAGVVPSGTQPPPTGGAPGWGAESSRWGPRWPDGIHTPRTPPEAAPGRPAGVPAGHAVPGLGPGGRRGAQAAAGLDGRATQDEAGPASLRGTEQRSPPESPSGAVSGGARPRPSSSPPSICSSALRLGRPGQGWASGQPGVSSPESCSQCWAGAATQGPTGPSCAGRTAWSRS